jgi:hypothetical protein
MPRRMLKWVLEVTDTQEIWVPEDTTFRHIDEQYGTVTLWGDGDPDRPLEARGITIIGTGRVVPDGVYLGNVLTASGALVWHVYEQTEATS